MRIEAFSWGIAACFLSAGAVHAVDLDAAPIRYWSGPARDAMSRVMERVRSGETSLAGASSREVLDRVLEELEVPVASQVLVFSKTSAQNPRIDPAHPRAIYFSDDCYVGWAQGGDVEVMTFDPERGVLFYLVEVEPGREPEVVRPRECLDCHERATASGVPGGLVRSMYPNANGLPFYEAGGTHVGPGTPIADRWGGWYVTGWPGPESHLGNALALKDGAGEIVMEPMVAGGGPMASLEGRFETAPYPGGGRSDVVALMILEHQVAMQNLLAEANLSVRQLEDRTQVLRRSFGEGELEEPEGTLLRVIETHAGRIVDGLLFRDEHRMAGDGIDGSLEFQEAFQANRHRDGDGRSLKDLRLYQHLFKYRCSYVIYADAFDQLHPWLKREVYRQLEEALRGEGEQGAHLGASERERIVSILEATKPDLLEAWTEFQKEENNAG